MLNQNSNLKGRYYSHLVSNTLRIYDYFRYLKTHKELRESISNIIIKRRWHLGLTKFVTGVKINLWVSLVVRYVITILLKWSRKNLRINLIIKNFYLDDERFLYVKLKAQFFILQDFEYIEVYRVRISTLTYNITSHFQMNLLTRGPLLILLRI